MIKLLHNADFVNFIHERRRINLEGKKDDIMAIQHYLEIHNIPLSWGGPIRHYVKTGEFDFPIDEGIFLKVGSQQITENAEEILVIRDNNTGKVVDPKEISVVITAKTKIDRIIRFIRDHATEIEEWQESIELSKIERPNWKGINIALEIIEMKNDQGLTFSQISERLGHKYEASSDLEDLYSGVESVKNTYHRFKKRLTK